MNRLVLALQNAFCISLATAARPSWLMVALCFTTLLWETRGPLAAAELDDARDHRHDVQAILTWENVTAKSGYLRGVKPQNSIPGRVGCIELQPGQSTEVFVPPGELVRVVSCDASPLNDRIEIWTSDGSGMYRKQNAAVTCDGGSMVAAPDAAGISLAKICRPMGLPGSACIAVFTSRRTGPKLLDDYQCPVEGCGDQVQIKDDQGSPIRQYWSLPSGQSRRLKVSGPTRLRIESRLKYGPDVPQQQPYWLQVYIDGQLHRVLTMTTKPNRDRRVWVDGCEQLVGRRELAYLDIDCGDRPVAIRSTHDVYLSVKGVGADLAYPNFNRSFARPSSQNIEKALSVWDAPPIDWSTPFVDGVWQSQGQCLSDPIWDPYLNQQRIAQLARNNAIEHGGLRAYMWMRAIAAQHRGVAQFGDDISVREMANRLRQHTSYRDLLPVKYQADADQGSIAFLNSTIRSAKQKSTQAVIGQQHLPSVIASIPTTKVFRLSDSDQQPLRYHVPEDLGTSLIRVVVDQSRLQSTVNLNVQFDDSLPISLSVCPDDPLRASATIPNSAAAALSAMAMVYRPFDSGTTGGPFAMWKQPVRMVQAATAEFVKPAHVKTIRVSLADGTSPSVDVGVQYLDAKTTMLPETAYRQLNAILVNEGDQSPIGRFAQQELSNDSLSTERRLHAQSDWFADTVQASSELQRPAEIWDEALLEKMHRDAVHQRDSQLWPEAIALYTTIIQHSDGEIRRRAIVSRSDALHASGEAFLAQREWRGWLKYSDDDVLQSEMLERLLESAGDNGSLREAILSFAAIHAKDNRFTTKLARQLMQNGRYRDALKVFSSLQPTDSNRDILLRCSYQIQWWQTFDEAMASMTNLPLKHTWMGLKQMKLGNDARAKELLHSGGQDGARWLEHWQTGEQIFRDLTQPHLADRLSALDRWETWQVNHPGRRRWVNEPDAITSAAQTRDFILDQRSVRFPVTVIPVGQRATINVQGPCRVRLSLRPIHQPAGRSPTVNDSANNAPLNDWISIESSGVIERVPIIKNLPASSGRLCPAALWPQRVSIDGLSPLGHDAIDSQSAATSPRPGQSEVIELDLPAGLNQFHVGCDQSAFTLSVESLRPEIPMPLLPWINPTTIAAVIEGSFGAQGHRCELASSDCWDGHSNWQSKLQSKLREKFHSKSSPSVDCVRMVCLDRKCQSMPLCVAGTVCRCNESISAAARLHRLPPNVTHGWQHRVLPTEQPVQIVGRDDVLGEAIGWLQVAATNQAQRPASGWVAEDRVRIAAAVAMHRLSQSHPHRDDLRELVDQVMSGTTWEMYRQFDSRAGVHSIPIEGWMPSSTSARITAAMFGGDVANHLLTGSKQLTMLMKNDEPTLIEVQLRRPRLSFLPTADTAVLLNDRSQSQVVNLTDSHQPTIVRLAFDTGPQTLQIHQIRPWSNHFVHVDLKEVLPDGSVVPMDRAKVPMKQRTMTYSVATADEPLTFRVAGPAMLRIDRIENGTRTQRILAVDDDRSIELKPSTGIEMALLRIYELQTDGEVLPSAPPAQVASDPSELAKEEWVDPVVQAAYQHVDVGDQVTTLDQLALRSPDLLPMTFQMRQSADLGLRSIDSQRLGSQRIGTLALDTRYVKRDAVEEFNKIASTERFFETKLSRFHYDQWHDRYRASHLIARARQDGGPTLGLIHEGSLTPAFSDCHNEHAANGWGDFRLNYQAHAYTQFDGDPVLDSVSSTPWSAGFKTRLSRSQQFSPNIHHAPGVTFFARTLSDHRNGYRSGELDQDVFTQYKSDHRQGISFSDRWVYQSCLDRRYWVNPSLMTNDDQLKPDHLSVQVGTDHLLGPLQVQLAYRLTNYLSDKDRRSSSLQNVLYLDLVWETWHTRTLRSELAVSMRNDLTNDRSSVAINFVTFFNHSRGFRDLSPGSTPFRSIRQERAAKHDWAHR